MILRRLTIIITFLTAWVWSNGQQINAVPDYVFRNQMSVGRNAVTDTAAYFSIGPRYGANKGFMPPIVVDTAIFSSGKRNGLLIFSVQKNKYLYWDSVRVQWSDMAGSSGSYIVAGDTASMLTPYVRHAGYGLTKSSQSFLVDTLNIATRAWRQKGVDSVAGLSRIGGSGTAFYIPRFATSSTLQNSIIYDDGAKVGVGTTSPIGTFQVYKSGAPAYITLTGGSGANQGAAFVIYKSNNSLSLINIGDKAALVGGAPDTAVTFRAGANVPLIFEPNASEALRLNNNQTITATSLAGSGSRIVVADSNGTLSASSALSGYVDGSGTTNYIPKFTAGSTIGNSQIFDNGTNVGIGTASPGVKLDVVGSAGTIVRTKGGTGSAQGSAYYVQLAGSTSTLSAFGDRANIFGGTVDQIASIYTGSSIPLTFDVNAAERLRITSGGDVGIGTTAPNTKTEIFGGDARVALSAVTTSTFRGYQMATGTTEFASLKAEAALGELRLTSGFAGFGGFTTFHNNGSERMRIFANGRVGINTTTDAGDYKLQVAGNIYNTGSAVLAATSGEVFVGSAADQGAYKFQVTGNAIITPSDIFALTINRSGINAVGANITTTNGGMKWGVENNDGGEFFSNSTPYASVIGSTGLRNLEFGVNGYVQARFTTGGEFLITSSTSDAGNYKLQVAGNGYFQGSISTSDDMDFLGADWYLGDFVGGTPTAVTTGAIRVSINGTYYYLQTVTLE